MNEDPYERGYEPGMIVEIDEKTQGKILCATNIAGKSLIHILPLPPHPTYPLDQHGNGVCLNVKPNDPKRMFRKTGERKEVHLHECVDHTHEWRTKLIEATKTFVKEQCAQSFHRRSLDRETLDRFLSLLADQIERSFGFDPETQDLPAIPDAMIEQCYIEATQKMDPKWKRGLEAALEKPLRETCSYTLSPSTYNRLLARIIAILKKEHDSDMQKGIIPPLSRDIVRENLSRLLAEENRVA